MNRVLISAHVMNGVVNMAPSININNVTLDYVDSFAYLGSIIIIMAGTAVFSRGWLPHRGKAQMACNYCFPTRTMF